MRLGWQAHISDDFVHDAKRVLFHRAAGDDVEVIVGFEASGHAIVHRYEFAASPEFRGLVIPEDALAALVAAVKPGPSSDMLGVLQQALDVERQRVDRVIGSACSPSRPADS